MKKIALTLGLLLTASCQAPGLTPKSEENTKPVIKADDNINQNINRSTTIGAGVPAVYQKLTGATEILMDGNYVVVKTKGIPENHKSYYYKGTIWSSTMYEDDTYTNTVNPQTKSTFKPNMGKILQYTVTYKIPTTPTPMATASAAPQGPIGVSTNGVSIYSPLNGQGVEAKEEAVGFDSHGGHPDPADQYHYHMLPLDLISGTNNPGSLIGFMLDGYPVYGPKESNGTTTPTGLDSNNGHTGPTADYPNGIYHYHVGATKLLSGYDYYNNGYMKGVLGTVTYNLDFSSQDWSGYTFIAGKLGGADMRNGVFVGTDFTSADLANTNLTSANLTNANLTSATMTNSTLTSATLAGATWTDGTTICNSSSVGSCTDYDSYEPASTNLMLNLKLNGNTTDSSGKGKNGTAVNSPTLTTDRLSKSNKAYKFDGSTQNISLPPLFNSTSHPGEVTVEAWVNPSVTPSSDTYPFYHGENGEFTLVCNSNSVRFASKLSNANWYNVVSNSALPSNSWSHIVGVYKKGSNIKIYVNGVLKNTTSIPDMFLFNPGAVFPASIGSYANTSKRFNGSIDQVKVYNKALTDTEILTTYNTEK